MDKEKKRRIAYEIMILMGVLLLLALITRVWPVIFLIFLGILICALRMLFLSFNKATPIKPAEPTATAAEPKLENEQAIISSAFRLLQVRITENLMARYPGARWVWSTCDAMDHFAHGEELIIMLNSAGGFTKAKVIFNNLLFCSIEYIGLKDPSSPDSSADLDIEPGTGKKPDIDTDDEDVDEYEGPDEDALPINYERLAFDWVESRLSEINMKTNEAIAKKKKTIFFPSEDLPHPDSWPNICAELKRNGFPSADITEDGINSKLPE